MTIITGLAMVQETFNLKYHFGLDHEKDRIAKKITHYKKFFFKLLMIRASRDALK